MIAAAVGAPPILLGPSISVAGGPLSSCRDCIFWARIGEASLPHSLEAEVSGEINHPWPDTFLMTDRVGV